MFYIPGPEVQELDLGTAPGAARSGALPPKTLELEDEWRSCMVEEGGRRMAFDCGWRRDRPEVESFDCSSQPLSKPTGRGIVRVADLLFAKARCGWRMGGPTPQTGAAGSVAR